MNFGYIIAIGVPWAWVGKNVPAILGRPANKARAHMHYAFITPPPRCAAITYRANVRYIGWIADITHITG
jgi:hypothetical protein